MLTSPRFIGTSNEHDLPAQRGAGIEFELFRHWMPPWSDLRQGLRAGTMRRDVTVGAHLQFAHAPYAATLPQLGLPERVETLDRVLHPVLERRHEYGSHGKLQAQADGADGVCKMMGGPEIRCRCRIGHKSAGHPAANARAEDEWCLGCFYPPGPTRQSARRAGS